MRCGLQSSLGVAARCSGDHPAGSVQPTCSAAQATALDLAPGAYATLDPASDAGCVTIAANASSVDSAEYLLVPQSAATTFGQSSPFVLRPATLAAAAILPAAITPRLSILRIR